MPMQHKFVEPAVFMTHKGVNVYHVYLDNDVEQPTVPYTFTLNPRVDSEYFDVRTLSPALTQIDHSLLRDGFEKERVPYIQDALRRYIDHNLLQLAAKSNPIFPELALEHRGVRVYHAYVAGEPDRGRLNYTFTLRPDKLSMQNGDDTFDIKTLQPGNIKYITGAYEEVMAAATPEQAQQRARWAHWDKEVRAQVVQNLLIQAIEQGHLTDL